MPGEVEKNKSGSVAKPMAKPQADRKPEPPDPGTVEVKTVRLAIAAMVAIAVILVLAVTMLGKSDDNSSGEPPVSADGTPAGYTESQLKDQSGNLPHAAYWVGPRDGVSQYELTATAEKSSATTACSSCIYVRYLTGDASVGDSRADFLTVASYSLPDAKAALETSADKGPDQKLSDENGYTTLTGGDANHAYVVFDDELDIQVEVFSPNPGEADDLVSSGAVEALG